MNSFENCPYGVNIDNHFEHVLAKCNFSGEELGFPSDSEIDKGFYGGCPYNKLYTKCEEYIKE